MADEQHEAGKASESDTNVLLCAKWRTKAITLREEANRIRRTIKSVTGAEERCNVKAEIYDKCATELEST